MLNNIKLTLEYDGTNYYGWQKQKGFKTIQGEIEEAIELVTKEHCEVIGSSRTDAGVHARGFVANFKTNSKVPPNKFREALNVKLPNDIVIIKSEQVDEEFHARYYAKGKTYEYYILNSDVPSALMRNQMYHYKYDLDVEAMKISSKPINLTWSGTLIPFSCKATNAPYALQSFVANIPSKGTSLLISLSIACLAPS